MQKKSITTLYGIEIQNFMLNKTETCNDMNFLKMENRVQCSICFKFEGPGETLCIRGSMPQGTTEEVKKQAGQKNQQSIHHVRPWNSQVNIKEYLKGSTLWKL